MEIDKYVMALMLFTLLIGAGVLIIADVNSNYEDVSGFNLISTDSLDNISRKSENINNATDDAKTSIFFQKLDEDSTEDSMFQGGYGALTTMQKSWRIMHGMGETVQEEFKIPPLFTYAAIAMLTVAITFSILYLVFRFQPR